MPVLERGFRAVCGLCLLVKTIFTLMWCQGSQVSMHVVRGSPSLFSSHGRGIGPEDGLGAVLAGPRGPPSP